MKDNGFLIKKRENLPHLLHRLIVTVSFFKTINTLIRKFAVKVSLLRKSNFTNNLLNFSCINNMFHIFRKYMYTGSFQ